MVTLNDSTRLRVSVLRVRDLSKPDAPVTGVKIIVHKYFENEIIMSPTSGCCA